MDKPIILSLPPSDNRRFIIARYGRRLILSQEHRDYQQINKYEAKRQFAKELITPTYENQLHIHFKVFLKDKHRDGSNIEKVLKDSLTGAIYDDDKWVCMHCDGIVIDPKLPRVELTITYSQ